MLSDDDHSPWASTFAQLRKIRDIRILTDFNMMKQAIERKSFPLPRIDETIQRLLSEMGFDHGGSELKAEFLEVCANKGIKTKPSGACNPQSNSMFQRVH